jgi:CheY-like chemotaxis protein
MANAHEYALILTDCQMPEKDGFEATRRQGQLLGDSAPRVIAVTARSMEHDRRECFDAGVSDHLAKTNGSASLSAILEKWIGDAMRIEPVTTEPQLAEARPAS